ncbi:MAG: OmpH family outer membrane protein [Nitrospirota bacterium]
MKRILAVMVVGFFVALSGVAGVAGVVGAAEAEVKIGYVDIDKAANDSEEGKKAVSTLKDYMASRQASINEKGKAIEKMKSDIEKQGAVMSTEARKSKIEEIERAERDFQRMLTDVNQELEKKRRELTESVYKEIMGVIEKIGQEEKYSVIMPSQSLLFAEKSLDITDLVIKRYNEAKAASKADAKAEPKPEPKKKK